MDANARNSLVEYVKHEILLHTPAETIVTNMAAAGYPSDEVRKIIDEIGRPDQTVARAAHRRHIAHIVTITILCAIIAFLTVAYMLGGS